jgi:putative ABC transport system permease protein
MTFLDMVALAFDNLRRSRLRTALTTLGVVIGIGALTSMVGFGTGIQKNVTEAFKQNDLFTSMFITSKAIDVRNIGEADPDDIMSALREQGSSLTDSTLQAIQKVPGVEIAFPEITFPVRVRMGAAETRTTLRALPAAMRAYKPYSKLASGEFFTDDSSAVLVIGWDTLKRLKLLAKDPETSPVLSKEDSVAGTRIIEADSIIGKPVEIISVALDGSELGAGSMFGFMRTGRMPIAESVTAFRICGILKRASNFSDNQLAGGIIAPIKAAEAIPRLGFSSVWDLLGGGGKQGTYGSIYVRVRRMADMQPAREQIEKMGLHVFSFADQIKEVRKGFLILDSVLGAIGTIALIVAALGIANTMVMSILERTREIGIMKAIGGSEGEIKMIFFVEAATIGAIGAVLGLILGWGVTRVANLVANARILPQGESAVNLFSFPTWLILGAIGFSILISLLAGMYPAIRAANIDPVEALRHD